MPSRVGDVANWTGDDETARPGIDPIAELISDISIVPPGAPFERNTPAMAAEIADLVASDAEDNPVIVKLIALGIGEQT